MAGFIVIDRKIKEWRWWKNQTARDIWIYMLLEANWKDGFWGAEGIPVKRGQFITSYSKLANETGYDRRTAKRWLDVFTDDGMCTCECTGKYILITLINYCKYQDVPSRNVQVDAQVDVQDNVLDIVQDIVQDNVHNRTRITKKPEKQEKQTIYTVESRQVIDYLNEKLGKHLKYTEGNLKHIRARFNEGFTLDDFKKVIDTKYSQWHSDQRMAKYLRPETLFGTKFDSYLNESGTGANITDPSYYGEEW